MAAVPHGYATFPGVKQILSCTYTFTHGIQPSVAILEMAPQNNFPAAGGDLVFFYGNLIVKIPDCRIDRATVRVDARGQIVSLEVFDWRWRWAYPTISGYYNFTDHETGPVNQIKPSGAIDQARVKNAQELARLCLDAMGEKSYNVAGMPTDIFPAVDWECENAAEALQSLAEQCGCVVVPRLNRTVLVAKKGEGKKLPTAPLLDGGITIDPPQVPDAVQFVCGPTVYQAIMPLIAVGLDVDGKIKKVDDLSYKPATGWSGICPEEFGQISDTPIAGATATSRSSPRDFAKRSVWRWYSIYRPENGLSVPGYGNVANINQILPLNSHRLEKVIRDGVEQREEAMVIGSWCQRMGTTTNVPRQQYSRPFEIDERRGLVMFNEPVFKYGGAAKQRAILSADMELWTSFSIRVPPTFEKSRWTQTVPVPGAKWNTGPKKIVKNDVVMELRGVYNNAGTLTGTASNLAEIQPQIDFYLNAELKSYQISDPTQVALIGLIPIDLDGAIQQVSWQITDRGTITQASRNCEFSNVVPPFEMRRRWDQIRRIVGNELRNP